VLLTTETIMTKTLQNGSYFLPEHKIIVSIGALCSIGRAAVAALGVLPGRGARAMPAPARGRVLGRAARVPVPLT
jgi:hypothetical protein